MATEHNGERQVRHVEQRTIDHVPVTGRHGKASDLFTIWFGSNIMLLTVATG